MLKIHLLLQIVALTLSIALGGASIVNAGQQHGPYAPPDESRRTGPILQTHALYQIDYLVTRSLHQNDNLYVFADANLPGGDTQQPAALSLEYIDLTLLPDPPFVGSGGQTRWTTTITNTSDRPAQNLIIQWSIPAGLDICDVTTETGIPQFVPDACGEPATRPDPPPTPQETRDSLREPGYVALRLPGLAANDSLTVSVDLRVTPRMAPPYILTGSVCAFNQTGAASACTQSSIVSATELPATGEPPVWRLWLVTGIIAAAGLLVTILLFRPLSASSPPEP